MGSSDRGSHGDGLGLGGTGGGATVIPGVWKNSLPSGGGAGEIIGRFGRPEVWLPKTICSSSLSIRCWFSRRRPLLSRMAAVIAPMSSDGHAEGAPSRAGEEERALELGAIVIFTGSRWGDWGGRMGGRRGKDVGCQSGMR